MTDANVTVGGVGIGVEIPTPTGMEYLSFSRLNTYGGCGEKFRLSYIEKVPQSQLGAGLGGRAIHEVIQFSETHDVLSLDEPVELVLYPMFLDTFGKLVEENGGPDAVRWGGRKDKDGRRSEGFDWWRDMGRVFLSRYVKIRQQDSEDGIRVLPDTLEMEVSAYVGDHLVKGFIDAMGAVNADGEAIVRDWKTGSMLSPIQLAVYSWLLAQRTPPLVADRGQFIYLRGTKPESWIKEYDLRPWRDLVPKMFTDLVRGIEAGIFPIQPSNFCVSCTVRGYCAYGKTLPEDE